MKKILWIAAHTIKDRPANGAEITDSFCISAGMALGYSVEVRDLETFNTQEMDDVDLLILSNHHEFHRDLREAMYKRPYVCFVHDAGGWMRVAQRRIRLFADAVGTVFLSPLHQRQFNNFCRADGAHKAATWTCISPYIGPEFKVRDFVRNHDTMWVGLLCRAKGVWAVLDWARANPRRAVDFFYPARYIDSGAVARAELLSNCRLIGHVPHSQMPAIMNRYVHAIHLPKAHEAFGRAIAEAYLCGCKIITNNNVGAMSYPWSKDLAEFRQQVGSADMKFWQWITTLMSLQEIKENA